MADFGMQYEGNVLFYNKKIEKFVLNIFFRFCMMGFVLKRCC